MTASTILRACALFALALVTPSVRAEPLPFQHKVEVFREKDTDVIVFALHLEQPFLAEEFEKSNYLRLTAQDRNAYLIYPKETRFHQKHAEFYGRLRGKGKAKVRLSYEIVSETVRGSRKVDVRHADIEIDIPAEPGGPRPIYRSWAEQQNQHFLTLLQYYPEESFYQYALLQSRERYGVTPPRFDKPRPDKIDLESNLFDIGAGAHGIQDALQQQALEGGGRTGDLDVHISELAPPRRRTPDYAKLLEDKAAKKIEPKTHDVTRLVPEDQYFLHFHSFKSATELQDLITDWGDELQRLMTIRALDNRLREKLEHQLCLRREPLGKLFTDGVVSEFAITGSDPFFLEGTDVTLLFHVKKPDVFQKAAADWVAQKKNEHAGLIEREFNYRGHTVAARYTDDRIVSSFVVRAGDYIVYSNSHRAIRQVIDASTGKARRLFDAPDYRYATILLPPSADASAGYFYASDAFLKRLVGPEAKISERRRLLCLNNQVMYNNASLFYRLETGKSPEALNNLVEGRFVDPARVVCPHGGAYSWDTRGDTCTCSLHNRLKYLTPNAELSVLKVSKTEKEEYERYKARYEQFWQSLSDPVAARITVGPRVKVELCVAPQPSDGPFGGLRQWVDEHPQPLHTQRIAKSAVASLVAVRGRKALGDFLRDLPGVSEALQADPTLTDLTWLGDSMALHFCDGDKILEIDPARFGELNSPLGKIAVDMQMLAAVILTATEVPTYITIDVEDREKAARLLELLTQKIPLQKGQLLTLPTSLDAYRLPDYKKHAHYVLSYRVHFLKLRLHVALVGNQLVAATKANVLHEVIDGAADAAAPPDEPKAHLMLRLNARALGRLQDNLQLSWSEKARLACHRNTISIYNLLKLYEVPIEDVPRLAEAKYGVRYFCPEHGTYEYDSGRDQVVCSVHGNRQDSRQNLPADRKSSFTRFLESLDEVVVRLRYEPEGMFMTVEVARRQGAK